MIATLSFKVAGQSKTIKQHARAWMQAMNQVMGKEINGITLAEISCRYESISLNTLKKRQLNKSFPVKKSYV